jgi:hypothetical protein
MFKINFKFAMLLILTIGLNSATAQALGNDVGHGGNAVICGQQAPVVLDYYNATLGTLGGTTPDLLDLTNLRSDQVIALVKSQLGDYRAFADDLEIALTNIGPMDNWISADLQQVSDSDEPYYLPTGCVRKTAAIRQDPYEMYGDPSVINVMADSQKGLLLLHEAIYSVAANNHQTTSTSVRNFMRVALLKKPSKSAIAAVIQGLGEDATDLFRYLHPTSGIYTDNYTSPGTVFQYQVTVNSVAHTLNIQNISTPTPLGSSFNMDMDCSARYLLGGYLSPCTTKNNITGEISTGNVHTDGSIEVSIGQRSYWISP